ncbi:hypothetical protein V5799_013429 [Amblyomma americanum]|uniref:Uncharacterized protein n=1 Tax=Amblyomma americanum TaxID=6943 RepID=A0AAQ4E5Z0_AMBAM
MAGMAWTLHPALLYDKYGPVLIQLWDSGALSNLFQPVRRLSVTIGDAITSGFSSRAPPATVGQPEEESSVLHITDESVATDDEAWMRVNREPGDTSPEPSTSQQNELAFQGDLYTQMRRNRKQQERIEKIRENRQKFVDGGRAPGTKRRGLLGRRGSILSPKKGKGVGKTVRGSGTPLADMECVSPVRGVVIDVAGSSDSRESSDTEDVGRSTAARSAHMIRAEELLSDNDSLKAFRAISGRKKRPGASPPPEVHGRSDLQSETASLSSVQAAEADIDSAHPDESATITTPEQSKRSFVQREEGEATKRSRKLSPPSEKGKNLQDLLADNKKQGLLSPKKSILRGHPAEKTESKVSQNAYKSTEGQAPASASATASESRRTTGIVSLPGADAMATTTMQFERKSVAGDDIAAPTVPTETAAKKEKTKRRKHKKGSHKKRSKDKPEATRSKEQQSAEALQRSFRKGAKQERGADPETKLWRKPETWDPSQDKAYQLASSVQLSSACKDSPEATATMCAELPEAKLTDIAENPTTLPRHDPMRPTGVIADQAFHTDIKWLQEGPVMIPTLPTTETPMVHTKIGVRQRCVEDMEDTAAGGAETSTLPARSSLQGADSMGELNLHMAERSSSGQVSSGSSKEAKHRAVMKPSAVAAPAEKTHSTAFTTSRSPSSSRHASERHKKHPRKRRSKPPAVAEKAPPPLVAPGISHHDILPSSVVEGGEKTMDEVVAPRHRLRTKKHGGKSKNSRRKARHAVDLVSAVSDGEVVSATQVEDSAATGIPQGTENPDASTTQTVPAQATAAQSLATTAATVGPTTTFFARPFSTDLTMSGISSAPSIGEQRPTNVTVVEGDEVRIHLDLTGRNRTSAFWPFGRKSHMRKK